ncbi:N-acetyl-gamma-glutamyl-phosphate reductase [Carboxydothermus ferrireducens]|uniref:N-acetyl-gamma-glutamyl-phosphate reductase n=1 Tax=Carboxydothermus ferrireducens DSM 11255 TaxID=1119529 RepID=A0ABX2RDP4_9THEO|nr:N-acetyl-gamma-glutamyl-phosphate reductase [Carboxydothermus ferrireducens]NYE57985.1 N-acetyl-gamma-glutamyl-phosphate reductase [Carboxydothermus ferrireducens DSM 11255]
MKVAVVGATGYTGAELIRLLSMHPEVTGLFLFSRGEEVEVEKHFLGLGFAGKVKPLEELSGFNPDFAFLALPHGESGRYAQELIRRGVRVIDLSADFRLPLEVYDKWYGPHPAPELLEIAVYGLSEYFCEKIKTARLIANPGCYPTAFLLAVLPLAEKDLLQGVIISDMKSGVTGAGRSAKREMLFGEVAENFRPYGVGGKHRHLPEMENFLNMFARGLRVIFTPHLVPMKRGILGTIYLNLTTDFSLEELRKIYLAKYQDKPFIKILPDGQLPETRAVYGTNNALIAVNKEPGGMVIVTVAIDNLGKGAAGQAVQNMNLMAGLDETCGLKNTGIYF